MSESTPAQRAALAHKQSAAHRAAYAMPSPAEPIPKKKKTFLKGAMAAFSGMRQAVQQTLTGGRGKGAKPQLGVFDHPPLLNQTGRHTDPKARPLKVTAMTYEYPGVSAEVVRPSDADKRRPTKMAPMDFERVYHEMKHPLKASDRERDRLEALLAKYAPPSQAHAASQAAAERAAPVAGKGTPGVTTEPAQPRRPLERNRTPEPSPVADTRRLRNALLQPPADLDGLGADVPVKRTLQGWPMLRANLHKALMSKANAAQNTEMAAAAGAASKGGTSAATSAQRQQNALMEELTAKESARVAKIARMRAKAYVAKAERNLLDEALRLEHLERQDGLANPALAQLREAAALRTVFSPAVMPSAEQLREGGLDDIAQLADAMEAMRTTSLQLTHARDAFDALPAVADEESVEADLDELLLLAGRDVARLQETVRGQEREVDAALAALEPGAVERFMSHHADRLFEDLGTLRDLDGQTLRALAAGDAREVHTEYFGAQVAGLLRRIGGPGGDEALRQLGQSWPIGDIEARMQKALAESEQVNAAIAWLERDLAVTRDTVDAHRRTAARAEGQRAAAASMSAQMVETLEEEVNQIREQLASASGSQAVALEEQMSRRNALIGEHRQRMEVVAERAAARVMAAHMPELRALEAEAQNTMQLIGEAGDLRAAAHAQLATLQKAADLAPRLRLLPSMELAAGDYFAIASGSHPTSGVSDAARKIIETTRQAVISMQADIADMKAHLASLEADAPAFEAKLQAARTANRQAEREEAASMIENLDRAGFAFDASVPEQAAQAAAFQGMLTAFHDRLAARQELPDGEPGRPDPRESSPAMVLSATLQALALGCEGNPEAARRVMENLSTLDLRDLVRPEGETGADGTPIDPMARRAAAMLAQVPRGMEVLQHLTGAEGRAALHGPQPALLREQAVQIHLQAQLVADSTPAHEPGVRRFRQDAADAARAAALADDPAAALVGLGEAERGAYHAFRNGMDTNAPGSRYDLANKALLEFSGWVQSFPTPASTQAATAARFNLSPFLALDKAQEVMDATGGPTPRRLRSDNLHLAAEQLLNYVSLSRRAGPRTFERTALQALLQDVAGQGEDLDLGEMMITVAMIRRAQAVARTARQAGPQVKAAALLPKEQADSRFAAEAAFETLMQAASAGQPLGAAEVLAAVSHSMRKPGADEADDAPLAISTPEAALAHVAAMAQIHPGSMGVQALLDIVKATVAQPEGALDRGDLLRALGAAVNRLPETEVDPDDTTAHELRGLLARIQGDDAAGEPLGPVLRLLLAHFGHEAEPTDDELLGELPRLRETLAGLVASLPEVEEAHLLQALLRHVAPTDSIPPGALEEPIGEEAMTLSVYRGMANHQRHIDEAADAHRAFSTIWQRLESGEPMSVLQLMDAADGAIDRPVLDDAGAAALPESLRNFGAAAALARDQDVTVRSGPPKTVQDLADQIRQTAGNLQWRDRLKMVATVSGGFGLDQSVSIPLDALVPGLSVQPKLILGKENKVETYFDLFLSSPAGPLISLGIKRSGPFEIGAGVGVAFSVPIGDGVTSMHPGTFDGQPVEITSSKAGPKAGVRGAVDARAKFETIAEESVALRSPRYKGEEQVLHGQTVDLLNDLFNIALETQPRGEGLSGDPFLRLLAARPEASMGPVAGGKRLRTVEGGIEVGAVASVGAGLGGFGLTGRLALKQEKTSGLTNPTASVAWASADSASTTKVTGKMAFGYTSPALHSFVDTDVTQSPEQALVHEATETTTGIADIPGIATTLGQTAELFAKSTRNIADQTYIDGEHFFDWSAVGYEKYNKYDEFKASVMARFSQWTERAALRAPPGIAEEDRYALGEKYILEMLAQGEAIAKRDNTIAALSVDILFQELDPQVDHLRREAWFASQRGDTEAQAEAGRLLEQLMSDPSVRTAAAMHLSKNTKRSEKMGTPGMPLARAFVQFTGETKVSLAHVPPDIPIPDEPLAERRPFRRILSGVGEPATVARPARASIFAPKPLGTSEPVRGRVRAPGIPFAGMAREEMDDISDAEMADGQGMTAEERAGVTRATVVAERVDTKGMTREEMDDISDAELADSPKPGQATPALSGIFGSSGSRLVRPTILRGVELPGIPDSVLREDGQIDAQATGNAHVRVLLPAIATLLGGGRDRAAVLAELEAMPHAALYATLERHAADSFIAFAEHGGAAPDLATAATALERIRFARIDASSGEPLLGTDGTGPSEVYGDLLARERERAGGLTEQDVNGAFERGRARGAGNVCMFDSLYQIADRAGQGARLRPFTGGAQGEAARTAFAERMQDLLAQTGLLARTRDGSYDQFEFEAGSLAANLLAQVAGVRLVVLTRTPGGIQMNAAVGGAGPEAFLLRSQVSDRNDGHFEPLWTRAA